MRSCLVGATVSHQRITCVSVVTCRKVNAKFLPQGLVSRSADRGASIPGGPLEYIPTGSWAIVSSPQRLPGEPGENFLIGPVGDTPAIEASLTLSLIVTRVLGKLASVQLVLSEGFRRKNEELSIPPSQCFLSHQISSSIKSLSINVCCTNNNKLSAFLTPLLNKHMHDSHCQN